MLTVQVQIRFKNKRWCCCFSGYDIVLLVFKILAVALCWFVWMRLGCLFVVDIVRYARKGCDACACCVLCRGSWSVDLSVLTVGSYAIFKKMVLKLFRFVSGLIRLAAWHITFFLFGFMHHIRFAKLC